MFYVLSTHDATSGRKACPSGLKRGLWSHGAHQHVHIEQNITSSTDVFFGKNASIAELAGRPHKNLFRQGKIINYVCHYFHLMTWDVATIMHMSWNEFTWSISRRGGGSDDVLNCNCNFPYFLLSLQKSCSAAAANWYLGFVTMSSIAVNGAKINKNVSFFSRSEFFLTDCWNVELRPGLVLPRVG